MANEQPTWGSMIWGAAKTVGLVVGTALVLPVAMNALGSALAPAAGQAANGFLQNAGEALTAGASRLSNLNSSVVTTVFGEAATRGVNFAEVGGLTALAGKAGSGILSTAGTVGTIIQNNPGTAAAVGAAGLGVGYMIRGAEASRGRPVMGAHTAELARQRQMAALAAQQARA